LPPSQEASQLAFPAQFRRQSPLEQLDSHVESPAHVCWHCVPLQPCVHFDTPLQVVVHSASSVQLCRHSAAP
jgi:hypothetical protein